MSAPAADADDEVGLPSPNQTTVLFGHAEAERTLLDGYRCLMPTGRAASRMPG